MSSSLRDEIARIINERDETDISSSSARLTAETAAQVADRILAIPSVGVLERAEAFLAQWGGVAGDREIAPGLTFGALREAVQTLASFQRQDAIPSISTHSDTE